MLTIPTHECDCRHLKPLGHISDYVLSANEWDRNLDVECIAYGNNKQFVQDIERDLRGHGNVRWVDVMASTVGIILKVTQTHCAP